MLRFLIKGVLRDRSRSLFSFIAIVMGVLLAVLFRGFMAGVFDDMLHQSAVLMTGHVKVTTRAWVDEADIMPNDLAVLDVDSLVAQLSTDYPEMDWDPRILFAGLLDVPDDAGETRAQGPMLGIAVDFLSPEAGARQVELWELDSRLVRGRLPERAEEVLLGERFAIRLGIEPGEVGTFVGVTMHGGFATYNFHVVGTVALGVGGIDQNLLLADLTGARAALDMEDGASAIFGLYKDMFYDDAGSVALSAAFNGSQADPEDEFSLMMQPLRAQNSLGQIVDFSKGATLVIILIFMFIVVVLLWNLGLMNGLRRYGEFGVRLAMGETKGHVYWTMLGESLLVGIAASVVGTILGLLVVYYLQEVGIDYTTLLEDYEMPISGVMRGKITPDCYYIGFIPGVVATLLGTMLAGRGIYKRQMSELFKELMLES
ncbi:MAG: FtsX-like permease family protein [Candidatus Marinimicrobia bacterium]|nr:FtsX-like permease family protein [Candidatus Neomarinimicrobiota bacterium]